MGERCNYAHGYQQLRPLPDSLRQQNGVCPYWRAGHCKASVGSQWGQRCLAWPRPACPAFGTSLSGAAAAPQRRRPRPGGPTLPFNCH